MPIPLITRRTERKITKVVSELAAATDSGERPTEALIKLAEQWRLTPHQIRLAARAYNTAAILSQLEAKELEKRAAAPALINPEEVIQALGTPDEIKQAEAQAPVVSDDYSKPPSRVIGPPQEPPPSYLVSRPFIKAAKQPALEIDERLFRREIRISRVMLERTFAEKLASLRSFFASDKAIDPKEVSQNAIAMFGSRAAQFVKLACRKVAASPRKNVAVDPQAPPYCWIKEALDIADEYVALDQLESKLPKEPSPVSQAPAIRPITTASVLDDDIWTEKEAEESILHPRWAKEAAIGFLGGLVGGGVSSSVRESLAPPGLKQKDIVKVVEDPVSDTELAAVRVKTMLAKLAVQDPIISNFKIEDITNVYNSLSAVAPRAMQQESIAKTFLRLALTRNGVVDPYDLANLQKLNKELEQVAAASEGRVIGPLAGAPSRRRTPPAEER